MMGAMRMRLILAALTATLAAACSSSSSALTPYFPGPTPTVYAGTVTDSIGGSGTVSISLTAVQGLMSGTWDMSFAGKADPRRYISGTLSGSAYTATVEQCPTGCAPDCRFVFTGTVSSSNLIGTYTPVVNGVCPAHAGSVSATKQ
jgi:hypothetical protein